MNRILASALFLAAVALVGCSFEDPKAPDSTDVTVVDNTPPMPDDLGQPDVPQTDTTPEVEPDLGVDNGVDDSTDASTEPDVTTDVPETCVPECKGKVCGSDGCGGECGTCEVMPCKGTPECVQNTCVYAVVSCDDYDACTTEYCDEATSACVYTAVVCDDEDLCTVDSCDKDKGCVSTPKDCSKEPGVNGCWTASCFPETGECGYQPVVCDDGDPCTVDSCDKDKGCVSATNSCDDGDLCTEDVCDPENGYCQHPKKSCDDGLNYTNDSCNPETGACEYVVVAGACLKDTDCSDGNPCTEDVCDSITHRCKLVEVVCDDGNACSTEKCRPAPIGVLEYVCETVEYKDCDDGNACTWDWCNPETGECTHGGVSCDDGSACTLDSCYTDLGCVYTQMNCDDGNRCTSDFCSDWEGGCYHKAIAGCCNSDSECADSEYCGDGSCWNLGCSKSGECSGWVAKNHQCEQWTAVAGTPCDDGNPDTPKTECDGNGACSSVPLCVNDTDCEDHNRFTEDVCDRSNKAWECKHYQEAFAFSCLIPTEWQAADRWCEIWVAYGANDLIGNPTQDVILLKENGERLSAEAICTSWWTPYKLHINVRVFGPGIDRNTAPWVSGSYAKMSDPAGNNVPLEKTDWGYPATPNWGPATIPWCQ